MHCIQYSSFSSMCADVMKTVCSPAKMHSILADVQSHSNVNVMVKKLTAVSKTLALFVRRIQSEFREYSSLAEPFLLALFQVCACANYTH